MAVKLADKRAALWADQRGLWGFLLAAYLAAQKVDPWGLLESRKVEPKAASKVELLEI